MLREEVLPGGVLAGGLVEEGRPSGVHFPLGGAVGVERVRAEPAVDTGLLGRCPEESGRGLSSGSGLRRGGLGWSRRGGRPVLLAGRAEEDEEEGGSAHEARHFTLRARQTGVPPLLGWPVRQRSRIQPC